MKHKLYYPAVGLALFLSGCAFVIRFPAFTHKQSIPPKTYRGAYHVHSDFSHDSKATLSQIINAAERAELDFVVITDHNTIKGAQAYAEMDSPTRPLLIFGTEISTESGHVVGLGIKEEPPELWEAGKAVAWIHEQGGHSVLAHPVSPKKRWTDMNASPVTGIEVFSFPDVYYMQPIRRLAIKGSLLPPRQFLDSVTETPTDAFRLWDSKLETQPIAAFGSVDAHLRWKYFSVAPENYLLYMQSVTTYVISKNFEEKSLIEALVAGKSYVAFEARGDATTFTFKAVAGDQEHGLGSTVNSAGNIDFKIELPQEAQIRLIRNGSLTKSVAASRMSYASSEKGVYRVEVYKKGKIWIISNPIYVK